MGENTLSFCFLDDLQEKVSVEWKFSDYSELYKILDKLWDDFIAKKYKDPSGWFFTAETRFDSIEKICKSLRKKSYCVFNRYEKYYVVAFAINFTRFYVWSRDYPPQLIEWRKTGPIVNNYDPNHNKDMILQALMS